MHIVEQEKYKVACQIEPRDLKAHGITVNDLLERTPLGQLFIRKAGELCRESTDYEWPGCGMTMQMDFYTNTVVLIFSERIEDYLYHLRQSVLALSGEQADRVNKLIAMISMAEEDEARRMISTFERSMQELK
jgi:hypothetical protein